MSTQQLVRTENKLGRKSGKVSQVLEESSGYPTHGWSVALSILLNLSNDFRDPVGFNRTAEKLNPVLFDAT